MPGEAPVMSPPQRMLRFALEVCALAAISAFGYRSGGWTLGIMLPLIAAIVSGTVGVTDDPRSGKGPVKVPGAVRLGVELLIFAAAGAGLAVLQWWAPLGAFAVAVIVHHALTISRVRWLLSR